MFTTKKEVDELTKNADKKRKEENRKTFMAGVRKITMSKIIDHNWNSNSLGIRLIVSLRCSMTSAARAVDNHIEDQPYAARCEKMNGPGSADEAGYSVRPPKSVTEIEHAGYIAAALDFGDMPPELVALCESFCKEFSAPELKKAKTIIADWLPRWVEITKNKMEAAC